MPRLLSSAINEDVGPDKCLADYVETNDRQVQVYANFHLDSPRIVSCFVTLKQKKNVQYMKEIEYACRGRQAASMYAMHDSLLAQIIVHVYASQSSTREASAAALDRSYVPILTRV